MSEQACSDSAALIAMLRAAGAELFDPVRLHYIEALARRAGSHQGNVRRMLDLRLARSVSEFRHRLDLARDAAAACAGEGMARHPDAASDLQRLLDGGDIRGMHRLLAGLRMKEQGAPLAELVRQLEQSSGGDAASRAAGDAGPRPELKTLRNFRSTWSKLSAGNQVAQALRMAPKNAGPINSHMLMLRSLALMRDISPDYLNRFMSYADALLCLDQGEKEKPAVKKTQQSVRKARK